MVSLRQPRGEPALAACPLVIVSDVAAQTDTGRFAHIRFPALARARRMARSPTRSGGYPVSAAFCRRREAKADWWIIARGAGRWGIARRLRQHPHDVFREHAALSGFENDGQRAFDIGALADLSREAWDAMRGALAGQPQRGRTGYHARLAWRWQAADGAGDASTDPGDNRCLYPLILNSGRIRDQWHTMTRTGAVPRLMQHIAEPMVVAPQDAVRYQLPADGLRGSVAAWGDGGESGDQRRAAPRLAVCSDALEQPVCRQGRVNNLLAAVTDPYSGQPEVNRRRWRLPRQPAAQQLYREPLPFPAAALAAAGDARRAALLGPGRHLPDSGSARGARRGWQLQVADGGAVWNPAGGIRKADARLVEAMRASRRWIAHAFAAVRCRPTTCA